MKLPDLTGGACLDVDPDLFHAPRRKQQEAARRVCRSCPIREACLDAYLEFERGWSPYLREGVFGGLTPDERAAIDHSRYPDAVPSNRPHAPRVMRKVPA